MPAPQLAISHFGLFVTDLARMREFYTKVMGFLVTDEGQIDGRNMVFLSRDPIDHHQVVLAEGRPVDSKGTPILNQLSFRVQTLEEVREAHRRLLQEPDVTKITPINHGTAWSVYFHDPDGNRTEIFTDTPWYVHQPYRQPLDLSLSDEGIAAATEKMLAGDPTTRSAADWKAEFEGRVRQQAREA
jgi:catechol 2,3-dioxygenase-like lactoylglutathione lyase family enzyme